MKSTKTLVEEVLEKMEHFSGTGKSAVVGLDGYIDKIQHPVQFQKEEGNVYYKTLLDFGDKIIEASNQSAQMELFTQQTKFGGNAPIMANALACLQIPNVCLGTFGYPKIEDDFKAIHQHSELISVGGPARTNALEFNDGKLILSELSVFQDLDWEAVKQKINIYSLKDHLEKAELIALVDWCNLPHATAIWKGMLEDIISKQAGDRRQFFFDLADPSKKSIDEVMGVIAVIQEYRSYGTVTLGLNENEANKIFKLLHNGEGSADLQAKGQYIFNTIQVDNLVIHPLDGCMTFQEDICYTLKKKLVHHPKVTTGGGDNFNAGYCLGMLYGFPTEHCMALAMATSGSYVANGRSPELKDIVAFLKYWLWEIEQGQKTEEYEH
ncbi:MAG: hypothetical protein AAGF77_07890 [Bacteroidota bacterium]